MQITEMNKAIKQMRKEYKRLLKGKKINLTLQPWPTVSVKTTVRWEDDNYATADENAIEDQIQKAIDKYRDELYLEYWPACEPTIREMNAEIRALIDRNKEVAEQCRVDQDWLWDQVIDGVEQ